MWQGGSGSGNQGRTEPRLLTAHDLLCSWDKTGPPLPRDFMLVRPLRYVTAAWEWELWATASLRPTGVSLPPGHLVTALAPKLGERASQGALVRK